MIKDVGRCDRPPNPSPRLVYFLRQLAAWTCAHLLSRFDKAAQRARKTHCARHQRRGPTALPCWPNPISSNPNLRRVECGVRIQPLTDKAEIVSAARQLIVIRGIETVVVSYGGKRGVGCHCRICLACLRRGHERYYRCTVGVLENCHGRRYRLSAMSERGKTVPDCARLAPLFLSLALAR